MIRTTFGLTADPLLGVMEAENIGDKSTSYRSLVQFFGA